MHLPGGRVGAQQTRVTRRLQEVPCIARGPSHGPHALAQLVLDLRFDLRLQLREQGRWKK